MKILVSHNPENISTTPVDGEIVMFSLYQGGDDNSMIGITSGLFSESVRIEEMNLTRDFIYDILKNTVTEKYKAKFKGEDAFEVMSCFKYNLADIVDELLEKAKEFDAGDVLRVSGHNLEKFIKEERIVSVNANKIISELEKLYAECTNPDREVDAFNWGVKTTIDKLKELL